MAEFWEAVHIRGQQTDAVWLTFGPAVQVGTTTQAMHAADVLQDVFMSIAMGIGQFHREPNQRGAFKAWVWRVTQSRIQDHFRRRTKGPAAGGGSKILQQINAIPDPFSDRSETVSGAVDSSLVMRAADLVRSEFSDATWQAFWQVAIEDKPTDVVAQQLHMSTAAVRQANYRVRRRIRAELQDFFDD